MSPFVSSSGVRFPDVPLLDTPVSNPPATPLNSLTLRRSDKHWTPAGFEQVRGLRKRQLNTSTVPVPLEPSSGAALVVRHASFAGNVLDGGALSRRGSAGQTSSNGTIGGSAAPSGSSGGSANNDAPTLPASTDPTTSAPHSQRPAAPPASSTPPSVQPAASPAPQNPNSQSPAAPAQPTPASSPMPLVNDVATTTAAAPDAGPVSSLAPLAPISTPTTTSPAPFTTPSALSTRLALLPIASSASLAPLSIMAAPSASSSSPTSASVDPSATAAPVVAAAPPVVDVSSSVMFAKVVPAVLAVVILLLLLFWYKRRQSSKALVRINSVSSLDGAAEEDSSAGIAFGRGVGAGEMTQARPETVVVVDGYSREHSPVAETKEETKEVVEGGAPHATRLGASTAALFGSSARGISRPSSSALAIRHLSTSSFGDISGVDIGESASNSQALSTIAYPARADQSLESISSSVHRGTGGYNSHSSYKPSSRPLQNVYYVNTRIAPPKSDRKMSSDSLESDVSYELHEAYRVGDLPTSESPTTSRDEDLSDDDVPGYTSIRPMQSSSTISTNATLTNGLLASDILAKFDLDSPSPKLAPHHREVRVNWL